MILMINGKQKILLLCRGYSMHLDIINKGNLFLRTAKEIWDATAQTYSKIGNAAQIYELKCQIHGTTQCEWSVVIYFHKLWSLWQELDYY